MFDIKNVKNVVTSNNISGDKKLKDIRLIDGVLFFEGKKITDKEEIRKILKENGMDWDVTTE